MIFDAYGLLDHLKKAFADRVLNAELDDHLDGEDDAVNGRNGYGRKTVTTDTSEIGLTVPCDRTGFDDKIIFLCAGGMSTREFASHVRDLYGLEVTAEMISAVTQCCYG